MKYSPLIKYSLIRFNFDNMPIEYHCKYPFTAKDVFVYLGDIVQMPGHCVIVRMSDNQLFTGYEIDNFIELTEDESGYTFTTDLSDIE